MAGWAGWLGWRSFQLAMKVGQVEQFLQNGLGWSHGQARLAGHGL